MNRLAVWVLLVALAVAGPLYAPDASAERTGPYKILIMVSAPAGINYNLIRDALELQGWDITVTGLTETVAQCSYAPGGPIPVDVLIPAVSDVTEYDVLLLSTSRWWAPDPYRAIMDSPEAMALITTAAGSNMVVGALCAGVRVLAAANVINGVQVTGKSAFEDEYTAAGAIFLGEAVPPVLDGNILTSVRNQLTRTRLPQLMATAVDSLRALP
jgi:putative intracellular protease/amidase